MTFLQLSKEETKELEVSSERLSSVLIPNRKVLTKLMEISLAFHHWKLVHNEESENVNMEWKRLSAILGYKYHYLVTYSNRNAVWGLSLSKNPDAKFLVYWSVQGLTIQYASGMPIKNYEDITKELSRILVQGKTDTEIMKDYLRKKQ